MSQLGLSEDDTFVQQRSTPTLQRLGSCTDCRREVSRQAISCPHCGSPFRSIKQQPTLGRIAGGVILGYLGILVINAVLFFVVFIFFAGIFANALSPPVRTPTSTRP